MHACFTRRNSLIDGTRRFDGSAIGPCASSKTETGKVVVVGSAPRRRAAIPPTARRSIFARDFETALGSNWSEPAQSTLKGAFPV